MYTEYSCKGEEGGAEKRRGWEEEGETRKEKRGDGAGGEERRGEKCITLTC